MDIGKKIRTLRLGLNLTQQELARKLDLTKGYISQVENNLTSPSLQTLFSILEVLGSDPNQFFSRETEQIIVYKKDAVQTKSYPELKHMITELIPNVIKFQMEPIIIDLEPGGQSAMEDEHPGEEFGYVLEGQITLIYNKKRYVLRKGESFYYQARHEHFMVNTSNVNAKVLWISSPPKY